mgnify:CR=1 FL=1
MDYKRLLTYLRDHWGCQEAYLCAAYAPVNVNDSFRGVLDSAKKSGWIVLELEIRSGKPRTSPLIAYALGRHFKQSVVLISGFNELSAVVQAHLDEGRGRLALLEDPSYSGKELSRAVPNRFKYPLDNLQEHIRKTRNV